MIHINIIDTWYTERDSQMKGRLINTGITDEQ